MSEPSQKCDNNAIFKQNYTQKLFISFKISYSCCFGFRENLEFPDFLQKKFYNIDYRPDCLCLQHQLCCQPLHIMGAKAKVGKSWGADCTLGKQMITIDF